MQKQKQIDYFGTIVFSFLILASTGAAVINPTLVVIPVALILFGAYKWL